MTAIRILHVDDESDFAASLGRRLKRRGLDVTYVDNGPGALRIMDKKTDYFDVILMDIKMPGMDGIKTLGRIKSMHPMVEVIMLTAHADTDIVISSLGMGAFDYLTKPVEIDTIVQKIEDAARRKQSNMDRLAQPERSTS